jgi:hypothetical protein
MVCIYAGCTVLFAPLSTPRQLLHMGTIDRSMLVFCALNTVVGYGTFSEALAHWEASSSGRGLSYAAAASSSRSRTGVTCAGYLARIGA